MRGIQALKGDAIHALVPGDAPKAQQILEKAILLPITTETPTKDL